MNLYIHTINEVIDYIEDNLSEPLTLQDMSNRFYLSAFHFSRLFKMVVGTSVKQYILGRKFARAIEQLANTDQSIEKIALNSGFEYTETFSRSFKKHFGLSPSRFRDSGRHVNLTPKALVVERDIANYSGTLALKEEYLYLDRFDLYGESFEVNEHDKDFAETLRSAGAGVIQESPVIDCLYSVVNCHGDESGEYTVFFGNKQNMKADNSIRSVPAGWYARFKYHGDLPQMLATFNDDFYRWMLIKEIQPCANGIGMISIFDGDGLQNVQILIPVRESG